MRFIKDLSMAFSFIAALVGAGLASGKEVVLFLGDAHPLSVCLCAVTIGLCALPFILAGIRSDGDTLGFIFCSHHEVGRIIVRIVNFVFLCAMLGGAEVLFKEFLSVSGGGVIACVLTLFAYYLGDKFIKALCSILMPLSVVAIIYLYSAHHQAFYGSLTILSPILYAGMNTMCAGLFAGDMCKGLKASDAIIISTLVAGVMAIILLLVRSTVVGAENAEIPLYSVAKDTDLSYFGVFVILSAILTSTISSLKLACNPDKSLSPLIISAAALGVSAFGFSKIVNLCYPLIGVIGLIVLGTASARLIALSRQMKLKVKKRSLHL